MGKKEITEFLGLDVAEGGKARLPIASHQSKAVQNISGAEGEGESGQTNEKMSVKTCLALEDRTDNGLDLIQGTERDPCSKEKNGTTAGVRGTW